MFSEKIRKQILIVDDESRLLEIMSMNLILDGFDVSTASCGKEAIEKIQRNPPDLVTLDIMLPGMDGFETLNRIRQISDVPVIIITAKGESFDKIGALNCGADDYLTKPFSPSELANRILSIMRRISSYSVPDEVVWVGRSIVIDFANASVDNEGKKTPLRPTECQLLYQLVVNAGHTVSNQKLLKQVWGEEYENMDQYLWPHIMFLRKAIEKDSNNPKYIVDDGGDGFRFQDISMTLSK